MFENPVCSWMRIALRIGIVVVVAAGAVAQTGVNLLTNPGADAGGFPFVLSGWFGGYASQNDNAQLTATFRSAGGAALGTSAVGPVLAADRGSDSLSFVVGTGAIVLNLGGGCGQGTTTPALAASAPILGQLFSLAVTATPNKAGQVLLSGPPAFPISFGSCVVFLDVNNFVPLFGFTTSASGAWSLGFPLPPDASLAGIPLILQAVVAPTSGPLGLDLTTGVGLLLNP